jgi:hypothetical protein
MIVDQNHYVHRPVVAGAKARLGADRLRQLDQGFPDAEAILLCCFDTLPQTEQPTKRLRRALIDAGFTAGAANYFIRNSRVLDRVARRRYRIRPFAAVAPAVA